MPEFQKIAVLNSQAQAQLLGQTLEERGIPHILRTYHDSAYDGVFQASWGWGHVEAPEEYRDEIKRIVEEIDSDE